MVNGKVCYNFYQYCLDVENQQLLKNGKLVKLSPKAFQVLLLLVKNPGQITKKEDIFDELWSDSFVEESNLTQNIYVLRKVLGKTPNGKPFIETIPKRGYRFTVEPEQISITKPTGEADTRILQDEINIGNAVEKPTNEIEEDPIEFSSSEETDFNKTTKENVTGKPSEAENISVLIPDEKTPGSHAQTRRRWLMIAILVLFFVSGGIAVSYYFLLKTQLPKETNRSAEIKSIAVLPFKPIGSEVDKAKLGLGMADAVITQLSKLRIIEVRPTTTIFRYSERPSPNPVSSGRELEVDAVLDGTVQTDGERVKVSVQLIRVSDGKSLWAESFNEKDSDIFAIQDLISKRLAAALSLTLTPHQEQRLTERGTMNKAAYQDYQLGIYFWNKRTKDDLLKATRYFQQAIELDPDYAQSYAGLADCYALMAYYGFADVDEMREKAKVTAEKALALNNNLAEAYGALGVAYEVKNENPAKALELHAHALQLAPYDAAVRHRYGMTLYWNGKLDEAVEQLRLAREYDPPSIVTNSALCKILIRKRNFSDAVKQCEKFVEIAPDILDSRVALARAYFYAGRHSDALKQLQIQIDSGNQEAMSSARGKLAYFYAKLGRTAEAEKNYADFKNNFGNSAQQAGDLALISYELGKKEEALLYFKEMVKSLDESADLHLSLAYDPFWDEIKKDSQFASLFPKTNHQKGISPPSS